MERKRHHSIPLFSTRATATASVALVLLILGIAAILGIIAGNFTGKIKENIGYVVVLNDDLTASQIENVKKLIEASPSTRKVEYSSPQAVLDRWQQMIGDDENIELLAGVNPFFPEMDVRVDPIYASTDSLDAIVAPLALRPEIAEVKINNELNTRVIATIKSVTFTMLIVAAMLLVISFVLIFNTIRLSIYSRRFTISTMKLVGATDGFIRRPFLTANMINGLVAGLIASLIVGAMLYYAASVDPVVSEAISPAVAALVFAAMILAGVIICFIAALSATNRYLSRSYDDMFK